MKNIIFGLSTVLLVSCSSAVESKSCPNYTTEQQFLLQKAHDIGKEHNLSETLAAIVKQESFVGDHVIRFNNKDGKYGSYGITHINLETAMWLEKIDNAWKAKAELAPYLMYSDDYAMELAIRKLKTKEKLGWQKMVRSYNGNVNSKMTLAYLNNIQKHVREFRECGTLNNMNNKNLYTSR